MSLMLANFNFGPIDICVFVAFIVAVIVISTLMSRSAGKSSEDYFLAGRGLSWWLIGFSLIAANISAEQFVGMAGNAAQCTGLAIASFEWIAAITLVLVGFIFLPMFLKCGIYTIPEFLEYRYNKFARSLMSLFMMIILVGVSIAAVIYLGALTIDTLFHGFMIFGCIEVNVITASWALGILAAVYVFIGGLQACAWADLLQGSALILGGFFVMLFAFSNFDKTELELLEDTPVYLRPEAYQNDLDLTDDLKADMTVFEKFRAVAPDKLHMLRPASDPNIVWTTLLFGIWIPNLYYWGLNQYIMQRTLGSRSLAEGQKGIVFAAAMKLIIPFIVVIPGILAFNMYSAQMHEEAQNDSMANKPVLDEFALALEKPGTTVFKFNREFADLEPELAEEIAQYNLTLVQKDAPADAYEKGLAECIAEVKDELKIDENDTSEEAKTLPRELAIQRFNEKLVKQAGEAKMTISKELVGYKYDAACPLLLRNLPFPAGMTGFVLAALFGAIMSSLASMLNAASTIFTMDIYNEYIHKNAAPKTQVFVGRTCVVLFMVIACLIVPILANPKFGGLFKYIQEFQGYLSPGVLVVFLFGLFAKRVPGFAGALTILLSPVIYGATKFLPCTQNMNYLNQMSVTFGVLWVLMMLFTLVCPRKEPLELPKKTEMDLTPSKGAAVFGILVVVVTIALYVYFW